MPRKKLHHEVDEILHSSSNVKRILILWTVRTLSIQQAAAWCAATDDHVWNILLYAESLQLNHG